jgi:hypothetical protein
LKRIETSLPTYLLTSKQKAGGRDKSEKQEGRKAGKKGISKMIKNNKVKLQTTFTDKINLLKRGNDRKIFFR